MVEGSSQFKTMSVSVKVFNVLDRYKNEWEVLVEHPVCWSEFMLVS